MSSFLPDADPAEPAVDAERTADAGESEAGSHDGSPDVRSGGNAGHAPRSVAEAEARWQDHESSGASWDSGDSI